MSNVLIVGDIVKDVYLRLDNGQNHFERDQSGVDWLDLAFDGSSQRFFARNAVLGGAAITLEVLARFGIESRISGIKAGFLGGKLTLEDPPTIYRYVVCKDDRIAYFSPSQTRPSLWRPPTDAVDYIYIDRSAMITRELAQEILQYTQLAPKTKLVMFVGKRTNLTDEHIGRILAKCDIIFTDVEMDVNLPTVRITEDTIRMEENRFIGHCTKNKI